MKKKFRFYRNSVYNCITNLKIEKFFSKSILYFSNCEFQNAKELQFKNIIKFLIVLPNRTMERCYKFAIKKIKITCYPSSFNFHSIFPGYTYPRLIVDRNLVAVQRSITRDFFFFSASRELSMAYVNGAAAGSKTFYQALGKIQYHNGGLKRGHIGALAV